MSNPAAEGHSWSDPGAEQVAPGILRIPLPLPSDGLRAVNVYVVEDGDRVVLVDGGWALAEGRAALVAGLAEHGLGLGDIGLFLVTHVHRDHYTQAVAVRAEYGTTVALGEGERPNLEAIWQREGNEISSSIDREIRRAGAAPLADVIATWSKDARPEPELWTAPDRWLAAGETIPLATRTLRVVPTPGHTRGHVVFVDEAAGVMFSGDHVLPHITPSIGLQPARVELPLRDFLRSLQVVRELPDLRMLPAHGPVSPSTHTRVDELVDHHERRLAASAAALADGRDTAAEVAAVLGWTRRNRTLEELDLWNRMLAVAETAAHLDVLVLRGEVTVETDADGVDHYTPR